jgi:hypothetical protein
MSYALLPALQWAIIIAWFFIPNPEGEYTQAIIWAPIIAAGIAAAGSIGASALSRGGGGGGTSPGDIWDMQSRYLAMSNKYAGMATDELAGAEAAVKKAERSRSELGLLLGSGQLGAAGWQQGQDWPTLESGIEGRRGPRPVSKAAQEAYMSPSARMVEDYMGRADAMFDPDSEEYASYYEALTRPSLDALEARVTLGERAITAEQRATERDIQNTASSRGAARTPYAIAALGARAGEAASTQKANLQLEAGVETSRLLNESTKWMFEFSTSLKRDAVAFAQEFVNNAAGIRDQFVQSIVGIKTAAAQIYGSLAGQAIGSSGQAFGAAADIARAQIGAQSAMDVSMLNASMELAGVIAGIATGSYGSTTDTAGARDININLGGGTTGGGTGTQPPSRTEFDRYFSGGYQRV